SILFSPIILAGCFKNPPPPDPGGEPPPIIPGCEGAGDAGIDPGQPSSGSDAGAAPMVPITSEGTLFDTQIEPNLQICRTCHVAGGVAETEKGRLFQLTADKTQDHDRLYAAWTALGKGVETNLLLLKPSNTAPEKHTGGTLWSKDGAVYADMKILL